MKLRKKIPLIDPHNKHGFWGGKFGGSFIPETLKKPVEDLTKEFKKLSLYFDRLKKNKNEMDIISMGMSGDYKIAIDCGSTMIRIGSHIFGSRN